MANRSQQQARDGALATLRRAVSCITPAVVIQGRFDPTALPFWSFPHRWAPLAGQHDLEFSLLYRHRFAERDDDPGTWSVRSAGYFYQFRDRRGDELIRFEWHPLPGLVSWPHLHVQGHSGRVEISDRMHIPTGHVSVQSVVRFAIEELHVRPLRPDWRTVLVDGERSSDADRTA